MAAAVDTAVACCKRGTDITVENKLHRPAGSLADDRYALSVTPEQAGWAYSSLRVLDLPPGGSHELSTGADEMLVLPLAGRPWSSARGSGSGWPAGPACSAA